MRAGALRHRITIERATIIEGDYGPEPGPWTLVGIVAASVEPLTGREYAAYQMALSEVTTRIKIRYLAGLLLTDRISYGGTAYNIVSLINPEMRNVELELMCKSSG